MPKIQRIIVPDLPRPVSHYCHVTRAGPHVWVAGVVGQAQDGSIPSDVVAQFRHCHRGDGQVPEGGRRRARARLCPLLHQQRTFTGPTAMSAKCLEETSDSLFRAPCERVGGIDCIYRLSRHVSR